MGIFSRQTRAAVFVLTASSLAAAPTYTETYFSGTPAPHTYAIGTGGTLSSAMGQTSSRYLSAWYRQAADWQLLTGPMPLFVGSLELGIGFDSITPRYTQSADNWRFAQQSGTSSFVVGVEDAPEWLIAHLVSLGHPEPDRNDYRFLVQLGTPITTPENPTPEPGTWVLLLTGLGLLVGRKAVRG